MGSIRTGMIIVAVAIIVVAFLPALPAPAFLLSLMLLVGSGLLLKPLRRAALYLLALLAGLLWASGYGYLGLHQQLPAALEGADIWVEGEVAGLPVVNERAQRFELSVLTLEHNEQEMSQALKKVRVNWYQTERQVTPGQRWRLQLRLKRPHGFGNPGGFDYQGWLFQQGIGAVGYVRQHQDNRLIADAGYRHWLDQWRFSLYQRLSSRLNSDPNKGLMMALLMGERADISREQWQLLSRTGTNHLFVISGLHVGFVALCAYLLTFNLSRLLLIGPPRFAAQQVAVVVALLASFCYAAIAGFSLPTQRALIMLVVLLTARLLLRRVSAWHSYFMALLLVLLWDPLAPQSAGFWLSFGAVGALMFAFGWRTNSRGFWWRWIRPQLVVFIAFVPVLMFFFQQVSLISPLANLLSVPIVGLVMVPLCVLVVVLDLLAVLTGFTQIETLSLWLTQLTSSGLRLLGSFLEFVSTAPFAQWRNSVSLVALVCACGGVLLLLAPRGLPARWLGLLCFLPLLTGSDDRPQSGHFEMTVLDVGQGLSVHIRTHRHSLIYDVGARFSDRFDMASSVILPYLYKQGVTSLNAVVISHGDNDHAGSLPVLLAQMDTDKLISGASEKVNHDHRTLGCKDGLSWQWDLVRFQLVRVDAALWSSENNRSCVLRVSSEHWSVLIPGDIEARAEIALAERYANNLRSDVLLASHHGSLTSSSVAFLDQVKPKLVIVSSGYRNRFGHPHPKVMARFNRRGIEVKNTARQGAIFVTADDAGPTLKIKSYRQLFRRYWR